MSGSLIHAGRDFKGAVAVGNGATATAMVTEAVTPDPTIDIRGALTALRIALAAVPGMDKTRALIRIDEAIEETEKPQPQSTEVENLVVQATRYAKEVGGFAEAAVALIPHLQQIASWLGHTWQNWAPTVGL